MVLTVFRLSGLLLSENEFETRKKYSYNRDIIMNFKRGKLYG